MFTRLRAASALVSVLLIGGIPLSATAQPGEVAQGDSTGSQPSRAEGRAALRAIEGILSDDAAGSRGTGGGGEDLTLHLRDLRTGLGGLTDAEREQARTFLARPDEFYTGGDLVYQADSEPTDDCTVAPTPGSDVCVHWATRSGDAPPAGDSDGDGLPDQVELTRDTVADVWNRVVTKGGYRAPLLDDQSVNGGPDGRLDVYLMDIGRYGLYGFCTSDDPDLNDRAVSAYCVVDDDFDQAQFGTEHQPLEYLQVTVAHEFFHAVQFAYDLDEDAWLLEGLATWVEDELYDSVNEGRRWLSQSALVRPDVPLDCVGSCGVGIPVWSPYGSWIFWRYLSETLPQQGGTGLPLVIRDLVDGTAGPDGHQGGPYSTEALATALETHGTTVAEALTGFAIANRRPGAHYEEGAAYPTSPLRYQKVVKRTAPVRVRVTPNHLSTATLRLSPHKKLDERDWSLRVEVQGHPASWGYAAAVTSFLENGSSRTAVVPLREAGTGRLKVPFSAKQVKYVEVTLTNGSIRYHCNQSFPFACDGSAIDDGRNVDVVFEAFRS